MLILDIGGKGLFRPQLDMAGFVDSLWKALPSLRSTGGGRKVGKRKEGEL